MPPKRSLASSNLTGGTGDVKPQILTIINTQTAADTGTQSESVLPVPRIGSMQDRATVFEVLWVDFHYLGGALAEADSSIGAALSTSSQTITTFNTIFQDPHVFAGFALRELITTSGVFNWQSPFRVNLMDGYGNGILVATDSIFFSTVSSGTGVANTVIAKIGYRQVNVGVMEYVGIVQSQQ